MDSYSAIERDDGAVFRMAEFTRGGARLPHDLRHLIVELELGVTDGIWGTIADGGMYASMRFAGGRRLPHDAARKSDALKKARHHRIGRAELSYEWAPRQSNTVAQQAPATVPARPHREDRKGRHGTAGGAARSGRGAVKSRGQRAR